MSMLDEIRARCACREAIRSPEVAKQRAATRSQEAARDEIYAIHAQHADKAASFDLETSEILAGEMDKDDIDKIRGWMSIHREELFANWKLLEEEGTYFKIEPLR